MRKWDLCFFRIFQKQNFKNVFARRKKKNLQRQDESGQTCWPLLSERHSWRSYSPFTYTCPSNEFRVLKLTVRVLAPHSISGSPSTPLSIGIARVLLFSRWKSKSNENNDECDCLHPIAIIISANSMISSRICSISWMVWINHCLNVPCSPRYHVAC